MWNAIDERIAQGIAANQQNLTQSMQRMEAMLQTLATLKSPAPEPAGQSATVRAKDILSNTQALITTLTSTITDKWNDAGRICQAITNTLQIFGLSENKHISPYFHYSNSLITVYVSKLKQGPDRNCTAVHLVPDVGDPKVSLLKIILDCYSGSENGNMQMVSWFNKTMASTGAASPLAFVTTMTTEAKRLGCNFDDVTMINYLVSRFTESWQTFYREQCVARGPPDTLAGLERMVTSWSVHAMSAAPSHDVNAVDELQDANATFRRGSSSFRGGRGRVRRNVYSSRQESDYCGSCGYWAHVGKPCLRPFLVPAGSGARARGNFGNRGHFRYRRRDHLGADGADEEIFFVADDEEEGDIWQEINDPSI